MPVVLLTMALAGCASPNPAIPVGTAAYDLMPVAPGADVHKPYRIGPLDTLNLNVFQEPDLTFEKMSVDAGGNIQLPLIGTVRAAGLTTAELSQTIGDRLNKYLVNPQVSISVVNAVSQKVTVEGSVELPGVYPLQGRTTLLEALALARSTNKVAALDQVIVFREIDGRMAAARFDVTAIRQGRAPNPEILGNDLVVVGFSHVKGIYRDIVAASPLIGSFTYLIAQ